MAPPVSDATMPNRSVTGAVPRPHIRIQPQAMRRAARGAIAACLAYALSRLLALPQGYWAVMTALIVMQASVGSTIGAALDRLKGTFAGAVLGTAMLIWAPRSFLGLGAALALITAISSYTAALRPELKLAPATAAFVMLMHPSGMSPLAVTMDRVLEIAIGGMVGISASLLVFPERSNTVIGANLAALANTVARLLDQLAEHLRSGTRPGTTDGVVALRATLGHIDQCFADAARERASRRGRHDWSDVIPQTFWRIRSDIALIGRMIEPWSPTEPEVGLSELMAQRLRADAQFVRKCAIALQSRSIVDRGGSAALPDDLKSAVDALCARPVDVADLGGVEQVVGLFYTMQRLRGDLTELAAHIDEASDPRG